VDVLITSAHYWPQGFASQNAGAAVGVAPAPAPALAPASAPAAEPPPPPPPGVHPTLAALFSHLAASYNALKKPRTLVPLWALGTLEVEVGMGGRAPAPFSGTVAQASLLLAFADCGGVRAPLAALAGALRIGSAPALRLLGHWVAAGVLRVERGAGGEWEAAAAGEEEGSGDGGGGGGGGGGGSSGGSGGAGAGAGDGSGGFAEEVAALESGAGGGGEGGDSAEAEAVWANYVVGMLSNLGTLPVDRIHATLKMFASMGDYPCAWARPAFADPARTHLRHDNTHFRYPLQTKRRLARRHASSLD
jgi:hypothetical protein